MNPDFLSPREVREMATDEWQRLRDLVLRESRSGTPSNVNPFVVNPPRTFTRRQVNAVLVDDLPPPPLAIQAEPATCDWCGGPLGQNGRNGTGPRRVHCKRACIFCLDLMYVPEEEYEDDNPLSWIPLNIS